MTYILIAALVASFVGVADGQDVAKIPSRETGPTPAASLQGCPVSKVASVTTLGHFLRFAGSTVDWKTAVSPAVTAGLSQLLGRNDGFAPNRNGYTQHYGVNVLGNVSGKFFSNFALPAIFQQDEQFERRGRSASRLTDRVTHILQHAVWAGQGRTPINVSALGGTGINAILANTYQPRTQRSISATAQRFGFGMLVYVAGDTYTEFSPDLRFALKRLGSTVIGKMRPSPSQGGQQPVGFDYGLLSAEQKALASAGDWGKWDRSQQLEFLGSSQALANWCKREPACNAELAMYPEPGLEQVVALTRVNGARANARSEEQYNLEVSWKPSADKCFENARGWGIHLAQLHPGMYGYDQNKANDGLLGLVVLFNKDDARKGQFHIGFGDIPNHYSAVENSDIERNYNDYCQWYGELAAYKTCESIPPPPPPNLAEPLSSPPLVSAIEASEPARIASAAGQQKLRDTVQEFLNTWYVQGDYDHLQQFIARDNFFSPRSQEVGESAWQRFFLATLKVPASRIRQLNDAITYREMALPKGRPKLRYINRDSIGKLSDPFAIVDPTSTPQGSYFPDTNRLPESRGRINARTQYLEHLWRTYQGRLYLVIYATKSANLVPNGVALYWILEGSDWKLAFGQTTD